MLQESNIDWPNKGTLLCFPHLLISHSSHSKSCSGHFMKLAKSRVKNLIWTNYRFTLQIHGVCRIDEFAHISFPVCTQVDAHAHLGEVLKKLGMLEEVLKSPRQWVVLLKASVSLPHSFFLQALGSFMLAVRMNPNFERGWSKLGEFFFDVGDFSRASLCCQVLNFALMKVCVIETACSTLSLARLSPLQEALRIEPSSADAYICQGKILRVSLCLQALLNFINSSHY